MTLNDKINKLEIRAASGFENLTPRPDIRRIFNDLEVEQLIGDKLSKCLEKKRPKDSTRKAVGLLVK